MEGVEISAGFERFLDRLLSLGGGRGSSGRLRVVGKPFNRRKNRTSQRTARPKSDEQFNAEKQAKSQKLDAILDKISKRGYDSLTAEEKRFLFDASNK